MTPTAFPPHFEGGIGGYTAAGNLLTRDNVKVSSNANALVNFGAGTKHVFLTIPAWRTDGPVLILTAGATLTEYNQTVLMNNTAAATLTLPPAASNLGLAYQIKKINAALAGTVTIDANASETIDGSTTIVLYVPNDVVTIRCDGTGWRIVAEVRQSHVAKMIRAASQPSVASGSDVKILFDTVDSDNAGIADAVTNLRFDIKRTGKYLVVASWHTGNVMNTGQQANIKVYVNNALAEIGGQQWISTNSQNLSPNYTTMMSLIAGDYVEMRVRHNHVEAAIATLTGSQAPWMFLAEIR